MNKYLNHWSATAPVFAGAANVDNLYLPESLDLHFNRLKTLCAQGHSLALLSGGAGVGKSTLARWLHSNLATSEFDVMLMAMVQQKTKPGWVLPTIANHMGIETSDKNVSQLMTETIKRLDEFIDENRKMIVIIDAAQNARTPESFDEIVGLLNLQDIAGHCLSFILVGNSDLIETVKHTPSLSAKANCHIQIEPLSENETENYITHRVKIAGIPNNPFDGDSSSLIYKASKGVLSVTNTVAENCLIEAFQKNVSKIDSSIVNEAGKYILDHVGDDLKNANEARTLTPEPTIKKPAVNKSTKPKKKQKAQKTSEDNSDKTISLSSLFKSDAPS